MTELSSRLSIPSGRVYDWVLSIVGTAVILGAWQFATADLQLVSGLVLASPLKIAQTFNQHSSIIIDNLWHTLFTALWGFSAATILGIGCAILFAANETVDEGFMPIMLAFNTIPRISMAPLIIFYIGAFQAKYVISAWIAFFPIFLIFKRGLEITDEDFEMLQRSLGMTTVQQFLHVRIPNALPALFDAMKYAIILAFTGAIVAELVSSEQGLGYLTIFAQGSFNTALVLSIVATIGIVVTILFLMLFTIQYQVIFWKDTSLIE